MTGPPTCRLTHLDPRARQGSSKRARRSGGMRHDGDDDGYGAAKGCPTGAPRPSPARRCSTHAMHAAHPHTLEGRHRPAMARPVCSHASWRVRSTLQVHTRVSICRVCLGVVCV